MLSDKLRSTDHAKEQWRVPYAFRIYLSELPSALSSRKNSGMKRYVDLIYDTIQMVVLTAKCFF
ncbi:hypothetical protein SBDP1_350007 [Syntrophobacter sp. SbD1]|nr:hypothetical protein SBDP1_350007 [Syntrophobacter sp. SbD1]